LLGYKKKLSVAESYYGELLEKEGFELESFLNLLKKLGIKGDYRKTYLLVETPKRVGDYLFFTLPKGAFATMYLKHCASS
jgi:tRNA pseudouridine13 synthase